MAYNPQARDLRRCQYVYPDVDPRGRAHARAGERCQAWARWDAADGCCTAHSVGEGGRRYTRGQQGTRPAQDVATRPVCTCRAYSYPHRPGGGLCNWPLEPERIDPTPAGGRSYRIRRPSWYPSVWKGAKRRAFDVTPDGVRKRSRSSARAKAPSLPGGRLPGETGPAGASRPVDFLGGIMADAVARGLAVVDPSSPSGYRIVKRGGDYPHDTSSPSY